MMHTAIYCIFLRCVSKLFHISSSSLICRLRHLIYQRACLTYLRFAALRISLIAQCNQIEWNGITGTVFINSNCPRRYFDYLKLSVHRGTQLVVQLSNKTICGRGSHWWVAEVDVLSGGKQQWLIAIYSIMIVLISSLQIVFYLLASCLIVETRCGSCALRACKDIFAVASVDEAVAFWKVLGPGWWRDKTILNILN